MVEETLKLFLSNFKEITEREKKELALKLNVQCFKKKDIIQEAGRLPLNCFFVLKGLVREYRILDGIEKTIEFYSELFPAIPSNYYLDNIPSDVFYECLEDSILIVGDRESESESIEEFPALQGILLKVTEEEWQKSKRKLSIFKIQSPQKRYLNFLKERSDLANRVPDFQIASYLGITPESLSRIKRRLIFTQSKNP